MNRFFKRSGPFIAFLLAIIMLICTALPSLAETVIEQSEEPALKIDNAVENSADLVDTEVPNANDKTHITFKQVIVISGAVFIFLVLVMLIGLFLKKNRKYNKFRKSLLINDFDETVELYEDLKPLEWGAPESVFVDGEIPANVVIDQSLEDRRERQAHVNIQYNAPQNSTMVKTLGYIEEIPDDRVRKAISRVDALIPEVKINPDPIIITPNVSVNGSDLNKSDIKKYSNKTKVKGVDPMVLAAFGLNSENYGGAVSARNNVGDVD